MTNFNSIYSGLDPYYTSPTAMLVDYFGDDAKKGTAIDLGCGDGRNALWLLRNGYSVTAIDVSAVALEKLRSYAKQFGVEHRLTTRCESVVDSPALKQSYDLVVACTILCHLPPGVATTLERQIVAAIKPGGYAYVSVFTREDPTYADSRVPSSETGAAIINHYPTNALLRRFNELTVARYSEGTEWDNSHGAPHVHGIARTIVRTD